MRESHMDTMGSDQAITSVMQVIGRAWREREDIARRQACIICGCADRCAHWHQVPARLIICFVSTLGQRARMLGAS